MSIWKKWIYGLSVLWGVFTLVFLLFLPSEEEAANMLLSQRTDSVTVKNIRHEIGLDKSAWERYISFWYKLSPIGYQKLPVEGLYWKTPDLGRSFQSQRPVISILMDSFPGTLLLAGLAMSFAVVTGIVMGMIAAWKKGTFWDRAILTVSSLGISMPSFFAAVLMAWAFGYVLSEYTGLSMTGSWLSYDIEKGEFIAWQNCILPSLTLGIRPLAIIVQLTRNSMLETLSKDYIRTARAKGLSTIRIWGIHALKNALNPVITAITGWFASLMAGAFFVEYIFNWKGLGKVTVDALEKTDIPVVMGGILWIGILFFIMQLITDLLYKKLDPRIQNS